MVNYLGTNIASAIRPFTSGDNYPTAYANELNGGFQTVQSVSLRNAIYPLRRTEGMLVYVIEEGKYYQLQGGIEDINWTQVTFLMEELDPVFTSSPAASITNTNITNWDTAYGWGNHASIGYLTEETDPIFISSPANSINNTDISNWNSKQDALISGTNIKTINSNSILGSGNLEITGSGGVTDGDKGDIIVSASGTVWTIDDSVITENKINISDVTTGDVSTSAHGFCPKAPNDISKFLRGDGTFDVPSGSGVTYAYLSMSSNQTNPATGQHIQFDTIQTNITGCFLATGTGQNNGVITLPSGVYLMIYSIVGGFSSNTGFLECCMRNGTTNFGGQTFSLPQTYTTSYDSSPIAAGVLQLLSQSTNIVCYIASASSCTAAFNTLQAGTFLIILKVA